MKLIPKFLNPFGRLPLVNPFGRIPLVKGIGISGNGFFKKFTNKIKEDKNDPWGIPHDDPETSTRLRYIPEVTIRRSEDPYYKMTHSEGEMDKGTKKYLAEAYDSWIQKPEMERLLRVYKDADYPTLHSDWDGNRAHITKSYWDRFLDVFGARRQYNDIYAKNMGDLMAELAHTAQIQYGNVNPSSDRWYYTFRKGSYDGDKIIPGRKYNSYAYPDWGEGETHPYFEQALWDYVFKGRLSPMSISLRKPLNLRFKDVQNLDWNQTIPYSRYINRAIRFNQKHLNEKIAKGGYREDWTKEFWKWALDSPDAQIDTKSYVSYDDNNNEEQLKASK